MKRKRLVFLAAHLAWPSMTSGGDVLFCELASRIRKWRPEWDIAVIAPDFAQEELKRFFDHVITLETRNEGTRQDSPAGIAIRWARRLGAAANALIEAQPTLVHSTGDFFIDIWPVVVAKRRCTTKWSGVVHHINAPPHQRKNSFVISSGSYALQRASFAFLRRADAISVLNTGVCKELADLRFALDRLHVVGAGIDIDRFPLSAHKNGRKVIWINRIEPTKGIFDLPDIVRRLPDDIVIDVIGGGPAIYVRKLRQALETAKVSGRCVLRGFVTNDELRHFLKEANVFISCSYEEGWGISIAEALAVGLPCIAYDLPSHRELFGDAIVSVPIGNTKAFATAITNVLEQPDSEENQHARRAVAVRNSLDECARRQEMVFASLLE